MSGYTCRFVLWITLFLVYRSEPTVVFGFAPTQDVLKEVIQARANWSHLAIPNWPVVHPCNRSNLSRGAGEEELFTQVHFSPVDWSF